MEKFSARFNEALSIKNLTCADISKRTGIYESTLSNYRKGKYEPKQEKLDNIAKALNVSIAWLMGADVPMGAYITEPTNAIPMTGVIPVVGKIAAGAPIIAQEQIIDYVPTFLKNHEEYFGLLVSGDSMINAGIPNGAYAIIHKQSCAENGQIVACRVNGEEATLKRYRLQGDTVVLMPENSAYNPIIISAADFNNGNAQILGVLKEVNIKMS